MLLSCESIFAGAVFDYFPISVRMHTTGLLSATGAAPTLIKERKYLFCYHPHGKSCSIFCHFGFQSTGHVQQVYTRLVYLHYCLDAVQDSMHCSLRLQGITAIPILLECYTDSLSDYLVGSVAARDDSVTFSQCQPMCWAT